MPVTPFHLGPGALLKSVAPRHVSFTVFAFNQVLIDLESTYFFFQNQVPMHRFFHTYGGAVLITFIGVIAGKPICEWCLRLWNSRLSEQQRSWLCIRPTISWHAAFMGSALGAFSHVLLDSIMHPDMTPFAPWSGANGLLGMITVAELHGLCGISGLVGIVLLMASTVFQKTRLSSYRHRALP